MIPHPSTVFQIHAVVKTGARKCIEVKAIELDEVRFNMVSGGELDFGPQCFVRINYSVLRVDIVEPR